ncbi:MAG: DUF1232 domain-containing protein [Burkholderiaceae bacterium]|nr:DUF1232 domain-containing protein [Burkholderiaceae bacterium]
MWKRLSLLWMLVKGDAKRLWFAVRHPGAPGWLKLGTVLILVYLVSPFDLVPETIPFFGVIDDLVLLPAAIRWMLNRLPPEMRADVDRRAGIGTDDATVVGR